MRFRINILGAVIFAVHLVLALLSYMQAPVLWNAAEHPRAAAFFESFGLGAVRLFAGDEAVVLSQGIPLAIATHRRRAAAVDVDASRRRCRCRHRAPAAALVDRVRGRVLLAFPLFTQDFWLSAAWGRMVAAGVNPFHTLFTDSDLIGLPLDHFPMADVLRPALGGDVGAGRGDRVGQRHRDGAAVQGR